MKRISKFSGALLVCASCLLAGCQNPTSSDIFDSQDVSVSFLEENGAVFFEDYAFAKGARSHVFRIEDERIVGHDSYPLVGFDASKFDGVVGSSVNEMVKTLGTPSYLGVVGEMSLDYSGKDGSMRRVKFEKDGGTYAVKSVGRYSKSKHYQVFFDQGAKPAKLDDVKKLKVGMCADEILETLGTKINYGTEMEDFYNWRVKTDGGDTVHLIVVPSDTVGCSHATLDEKNKDTFETWYLAGVYTDDGEVNIRKTIGKAPAVFDSEDKRFSGNDSVSVDFLKENGGFLFEDYAFASDSKNNVYSIEGGEVKSHTVLDKVSYPRNPINLFKSVIGMELSSTFEVIGIPSFLTSDSGLSVDYALPNGYLMSCKLERKDGSLYIAAISGHSFTWSLTDCWADSNKLPVAKSLVSRVENGMCVAEVTKILGKASSIRFLGEAETSYVFSYPLDDGTTFDLTFEIKAIKKNSEYATRYDDVGVSSEAISSNTSNVVITNTLYLYAAGL